MQGDFSVEFSQEEVNDCLEIKSRMFLDPQRPWTDPDPNVEVVSVTVNQDGTAVVVLRRTES